MNSLISITLNAGDAALTFFDDSGSNAPITLIAPIVTITAGSIDLADRALTIIATNGALTLNVGATITSTASLFLRGDTIVGLGSDITFNVPTLGLTLTGDERSFDVPPFEAESQIGTLDITTRAPLTYRDWMAPAAGSDRNLILLSTTGALTFTLASINLGAGNLTLTSAVGADIIFTNPAGLTLTVGDLTLTSAVSSTNLPLTVTASGVITLNSNINTGTGGLALSGASIVLGGDVVRLTSGAVSLTGAINEMANNRILRVIATGNITLNSNINLGTGVLSLTTTGSIGNGGSAPGELPELTASTVSLRQAAEFDAIAVFGFNDTSSLTLSRTGGRQTIHPWMQSALTGGSLTITATGALIVGGVGFDFGANNITLTSGGRVRIGANITTIGDIILTGVASSTQPAIRFENGARVVRGGNVRFNGSAGVLTSTTEPDRNGGSVTLTAASGILRLNGNIDTGTNTLSLTGATTIQIGRTSSEAVGATRTLSGGAITLTSAMGIEIGRFTGRGEFRPNNDAANFTVTASGVLTIAADITVADGTRSGGDIALTGGSIAFGAAARTITGTTIRLRGAATGTADLTITASGLLRINSNITLTGAGDLTLSGGTDGINFNGGVAVGEMKTLSGAAITLTGAARSNRDLTITASGILTINNDITLGSGLTLALSGAGAIVGTERPRLTASTVSLTQADTFTADAEGRGLFRFTAGSLMLATGAAQVVHNWMISSNRDVTIMSAGQVSVADPIGADVSGRNLGTRSLTLESMADIRIGANITTTGNITLNGATGINLNGGARTITGRDITLMIERQGVAMSDANVTITASGILTINNDIDIGTNALTLTSGVGAIVGVGTPMLTASTVSLRQAEEFAATAVFGLTDTSSLTLSRTGGRQTIHPWMQNALTGGSLTITATGTLIVDVALDLDFGTNNITLTSGGKVRIGANITTTGNITLTGVASSTQPAIRFENGARVVRGGNVRLNGSAGVLTSTTLGASGGSVTLTATATDGILRLNGNVNTRFTAADGTTSFGDLTLTGATIQIGRVAGAPVDARRILLRGQNITLTSASGGILLGRFNGSGTFLTRGGVANLTVNAQGTLTIAGNITVADDATSGGDIELRGRSETAPIAFTGARTVTGRAITLRGAATGTADLTLTARGILTINNDIGIGANTLTLTSGAGAISNGGSVGTDRPTLTASTVSLAQVDAFAATRLFTFAAAIDSLVLITTVNQDVLSWMIDAGRNLTVESSARVRVTAAIGSGGRDLGDGSLTLTSTGGTVRIMADITTMGDLTLDGNTGINLNSTPTSTTGTVTLTGVAITLTGAARSNRALTIDATGVLTINDNINIGTTPDRILTLRATGGFTFGSDVDLRAGDYVFPPSLTCTADSTGPRCP